MRIRQGCYALPHADPLTVAEVAWRGTATCISALTRLDLPVLDRGDGHHLLIPGTRSHSGRHLTPPSSITLHWSALPVPDRVTPLEAIDDAAQCLDKWGQLVVIDAALSRGLITPMDLNLLQRGDARRRSWLARYADGSAESPPETLMRTAMRSLGLHVECQVVLSGVGRVDCVVNGWLVVEVDGRQFHSDSRTFLNDRQRDRAAVLAGYTPVRVAASEVLHDPMSVAREIAAIARVRK